MGMDQVVVGDVSSGGGWIELLCEMSRVVLVNESDRGCWERVELL